MRMAIARIERTKSRGCRNTEIASRQSAWSPSAKTSRTMLNLITIGISSAKVMSKPPVQATGTVAQKFQRAFRNSDEKLPFLPLPGSQGHLSTERPDIENHADNRHDANSEQQHGDDQSIGSGENTLGVDQPGFG